MFMRLLLALCLVAAMSTSALAVDVTATWNTLAGQYNFDQYPMPASATFEDAYNGSDFARDFELIKRGLQDSLMGATMQPVDGDDLANATLEDLPVQ